NEYLDRCATVRYFFVRKVILSSYASAFVVLRGGLGTLDELFEIMTLIQTKRMRRKPIVLLGRTYWRPLFDLLDKMVHAGTIKSDDAALVTVTDEVGDAVEHLRTALATCPADPSGRDWRQSVPARGRSGDAA